MNNPFDLLNSRLSNIESLLLDIKHNPKEKESQQPEQPLNVKQAAKFLSLSVPTIYSKVSRLQLPFTKREDSKRLYFFREDLIKYLEEGRRKTVSEIQSEADDYLVKKKGVNNGY